MHIHEDYGGLDPHASVIDRLAARHELSLIIDRALEELDVIDGDLDLELSGDENEPLLGWRENAAGNGNCPTFWDEREPSDDDEPWLAAPESGPRTYFGPSAYNFPTSRVERLSGRSGGSQENWGQGPRDDFEEDAGDECEDENEHGGDILDEPDSDGNEDMEPSLGFTLIGGGCPWTDAGGDREEDGEDVDVILDVDAAVNAEVRP